MNRLAHLDNTELALIFVIIIATTATVMLYVLGQPVLHPPWRWRRIRGRCEQNV